MYLAVVLDLFSRRIVGWSMQASLHKELVLDALSMALCQRRPSLSLLHHSDRGSSVRQHRLPDPAQGGGDRLQHEPQRQLLEHCWDNAVVESFFGTLKDEMVVVVPPMLMG